jgi:hypothetical protein
MIFLACICLIGYTEIFAQSKVNQFTSDSDTLLIKMNKVKGPGLFGFFALITQAKDTTNLFDYAIDYPESLSTIKDIKGAVDFNSQLDDIDLIIGEIPDKGPVIIVDQNNNQIFSDDQIYPLQPIDWNSSQNSIPVSYLISDGLDTINSSSWIRIGVHNKNIAYGRDEHMVGQISIDSHQYEVGIIDPPLRATFTYDYDSEIALLSTDDRKKDSLRVGDLIKMNEYLELNGEYYKFDSVTIMEAV